MYVVWLRHWRSIVDWVHDDAKEVHFSFAVERWEGSDVIFIFRMDRVIQYPSAFIASCLNGIGKDFFMISPVKPTTFRVRRSVFVFLESVLQGERDAASSTFWIVSSILSHLHFILKWFLPVKNFVCIDSLFSLFIVESGGFLRDKNFL